MLFYYCSYWAFLKPPRIWFLGQCVQALNLLQLKKKKSERNSSDQVSQLTTLATLIIYEYLEEESYCYLVVSIWSFSVPWWTGYNTSLDRRPWSQGGLVRMSGSEQFYPVLLWWPQPAQSPDFSPITQQLDDKRINCTLCFIFDYPHTAFQANN